jgi:MtN3 and saliva related transmembrane protein
MITFVGTLAAILTTVAMFPQAIRIIKTKDVESISLLMYVANSIGIIFWFIYGCLLHQTPIILANLIAFIPACTILILKIILGKSN